MSAADRARLDTHIAMIDQLQSSLNAQLQCTRPSTPTDDADNHPQQTTADATTAGQLWCDIVAAAFACDASRIGVFGWGDTAAFSSYTGNDWHHDVAHEWDQDAQQGLLVQSYQNFFERVFVYLAAKLDSIEDASGGSVLDNTLMGWSQECCMATHQQFGVPVVTAGGAGGYLNTGLYCDYRQMNDGGRIDRAVGGGFVGRDHQLHDVPRSFVRAVAGDGAAVHGNHASDLRAMEGHQRRHGARVRHSVHRDGRERLEGALRHHGVELLCERQRPAALPESGLKRKRAARRNAFRTSVHLDHRHEL